MKNKLSLVALSILFALSARADIVPGLEVFGDVTLVDSIDCAADTTHRFRDYPAGRSYVTNILGSSARAMAHLRKSETTGGQQSGSYVSWRIGEGKGIVPNEPYVMVVDYPDDAPRSVTLVNFGIGSRHGYHTGFTVGESMAPVVAVPQSQESVNVPLSGEWKQLVEVLFPFERTVQYNGTGGDNKLTTATDGFDIDFVLLPWEQATDSLGVAVRAIRLYRINDYAAAKPTINYPVGNVPRRVITFREEMADDDGLSSYATPTDFYVGKARQMSLLGINTMSRDLLEFGYMQYWQGDSRWGWANNYWPATLDAMTAEGHYILPYYEYAGSRGSSGLGYNDEYRPKTLSSDTQSNKYLFSNQDYVYKCLADVTLPETEADLKDLMDKTIFRYTDRANFLGAWIRSRGQMPIGFGDKTIALFNEETGRTAAGTAVTRADIYNNGSYSDTALYKEYRAWWYGKRRDLFQHMQQYLAQKGLDNPKFFYHGCIAEGGESWNDGQGNRVLAWRTSDDNKFEGKDWCEFTGKSVNRQEQWHSQLYKQLALDTDFPTWNSAYEIGHSCPADDYYNYTNATGFGLSYPFNCVYTVLEGAQVGNYRNASGDLFLVRHYSLNEFCGQDQNLPKEQRAITGYFISDMDHAGRAVMISELRAMANWDPNMFGYMFGSEVDRLDATYVREFNLNYLSLPATRSEVLSGGGWGHDITVRRWTTAAGQYWAVINTGFRPYEGDLDFRTSAAKVYRTVGGGVVPVSAGKAHVAMEPLQMIAFTDIAPDGPVVGVECTGVDGLSATVSVTVSAIPGGSGIVTLERATSADFSGAVVVDQRTVADTGSYSVALTGLEASTDYYVRATLVCGDDSAAATTGFTSGVPDTYPRGSFSATAGVNAATLAVTLESLGTDSSSCDLYAVATPLVPSLSPVSAALGARSAAGPCSFSLEPLSSEAVYNVTLFATNSAGFGAPLGTVLVTTRPRPAGDPDQPRYKPGLTQHRYGCTKSEHPDWSVGAYGQADADRVLGTIMADVTGNPGPEVTNPLSGKTYKWADNTTFVYEGQMWFEGGVAYNFFHNVDDGVAIELDGTMFTDLGNSSGYQTITQVSKTYAESGWHDIRVWVYDWSGNKGYGGKVGNMGYTTGLGWNTNGTTSVTAADVDKWSNLSDPGDGRLLRAWVGNAYVSVDGDAFRSGGAVCVPLRYWSYDEDDVLTLFHSRTLPAPADDASAWTGSADVAPLSFPGEKTATGAVSGLSLQPGDTVYLIARLANARLGHESWSEPVAYTVPDDQTAPEFSAALSEAGFRDAAFSINVGSVGGGASTVTVAVQIGSTTYTAAADVGSYNAVYRTPYELDYDTDYTAVVTVLNNLGKSAQKTVAFHTKARVAPAATLAVGTVGFTDAALAVDVSSFGTDATSGSIRVEVLDGSTVVWSDTANVSATGAAAFSATGLPDGKSLSVRATVTTDAGVVSLGPTAFSTTAFGAPVFGTCEAANVSWDSATLSAALSALGAGSGSASVAWTISGGAATPSSGTLSFPQAGSQTASVAGLAPETAYTVTLVATGENGKTAETSFAFTTLRLPLVLSEASGVCNGAGTEATAKVAVMRADRAATLALFVDGAAAKTWTGVEAGAEYSFSFPIQVGQTKAFRFVLSADGCADVEKAGSVTGRQVVDWFNVPLNDAAYANWTLASGPDAYEPSATWTIEDERNASAITNDGAGGREILLAPRGEGSVAYQPAFPSEENRALEVSGSAKLRANAGLPPSPEGTPLAGLALGVAGEAPALFGWTAGGWIALAGTAPAADTSFAWKALVDFENATVTYYADETALAPAAGGAAALPLGVAAATHAERVVFCGAGAIGPFRGVYADAGGGSVKLWEAAIRVDGTGLTFTTVGNAEKFVIGLKEARAGAYYVAFAADSLDTPADDWVCVACSDSPATGGEDVDLPCPTVDKQENPIPSQFFKIYAAGAPVARGTYWRDCDFVAGE